MVSGDVSPRGPTSLVREKQRSKRGVAGLGSIPEGRPELVPEAADFNLTNLRTVQQAIVAWLRDVGATNVRRECD